MSTATELKNSANALFQEKQFHKAIDAYTAALEAPDCDNDLKVILYSNRAAAHLKVESYGAVIADTTAAVELNPQFAKAYFRRGSALVGLTRFKDALPDFKQAQKLSPGDKTALTKVKECERIIRQKAFEEAIAVPEEKPLTQIIEEELEHLVIEPGYTGPVLPEVVTTEWVLEVQKYMTEGKTLHRRCLYEMMLRAHKVFTSEPTLLDVHVPENGLLTVFGDVHGQYYDVMNAFKLAGNPSERHSLMFNGDFVDRGSFSCEVIVLLLAWKLAFPKNFFMLRGNHETKNMNKVYGFEGEVKAKYSERAYHVFCEVFQGLPLCATINKKIFVVHGGLFQTDGVTLDQIAKIDRFREPADSGLMSDMLWSDPQPMPGRAPSKRGVGTSFGPDVTKAFLENNGLELVIRSHEVKEEGYLVEHDGKLITVFSAPNYCDQTGNKGAFIHIKPNLEREIVPFTAVPHPPVKPMQYAGLGSLMM